MENFWHRKMAARAHEYRAHSILSPSCPHGKVLTGVEENFKKHVKIADLTPFFDKIRLPRFLLLHTSFHHPWKHNMSTSQTQRVETLISTRCHSSFDTLSYSRTLVCAGENTNFCLGKQQKKREKKRFH